MFGKGNGEKSKTEAVITHRHHLSSEATGKGIIDFYQSVKAMGRSSFHSIPYCPKMGTLTSLKLVDI